MQEGRRDPAECAGSITAALSGKELLPQMLLGTFKIALNGTLRDQSDLLGRAFLFQGTTVSLNSPN